MSIRYCLKCKSIFEQDKTLFVNNRYFCFDCNYPLVYFGREAGSVSQQAVLDAYDLLHPYQPEKDFKGVYKSYGSVSVDKGVLECEDNLKSFPHDRNALFYLTKYYWNQSNVKKSWEFFSRLLKHYKLNADEAEFYVNFLLLKKKYHLILRFIEKNKTQFNQFFIYHFQAIAYLGLSRHSKALLHFYRSLSFCDDPVRKSKIESIIKKINTYIEDHK